MGRAKRWIPVDIGFSFPFGVDFARLEFRQSITWKCLPIPGKKSQKIAILLGFNTFPNFSRESATQHDSALCVVWCTLSSFFGEICVAFYHCKMTWIRQHSFSHFQYSYSLAFVHLWPFFMFYDHLLCANKRWCSLHVDNDRKISVFYATEW